MSTYGNEALEYEVMAQNRSARNLEPQPSFEVVTGGGLDARARAGVSSEFLARVKMVIAAAILIFVLGTLRVALTSMTVAQLSANAQMREEISNYTTNNDNLRVERSLMSSAARIDRIATQNYGMVYPASYDVIVLDSDEDGDEHADEAYVDEESYEEDYSEDEEYFEEEPYAEESYEDYAEDEDYEDYAYSEDESDDWSYEEEYVSEEWEEAEADVEVEAEIEDLPIIFDTTQLAAGL